MHGPTPQHTEVLNQLAQLADEVGGKSSIPHGVMLFALTERLGVDLALAIKAGELTEEEVATFLERTVMIAALVCGQVMDDTYGQTAALNLH